VSGWCRAGRAVRAADGASLENWWAEMSLGFESLALRHCLMGSRLIVEFGSEIRSPLKPLVFEGLPPLPVGTDGRSRTAEGSVVSDL
jgi:hypothetical protein